EGLGPLIALLGAVDAEAAELGVGGRLAGAELDAAVGEEVERGDALGDAERVVDAWRELHDPVPEPDPARALARPRVEDLPPGGVGGLLEEGELDDPGGGEPQ